MSFSKNYIKIYLFQILSIVLGFISLFVVVPFLSANQSIYGVYTICVSITIFLSYADLGFLGAAQKYAVECFSRGEQRKEVSLLGFAHFVLLTTVLLISGIFLYLSYNPTKLISGLVSSEQISVAQNLLFIQAIFAPVIVLQRMAQMIFSIRLEDYNVQKLVITGNCLKIISVFYFFGKGEYNIVGYYLFSQIVSLIVSFASLWLAKVRYNYPLWLLFRNIRFSSEIFANIRALAFSSLFVTIAWVAYYEMDSVVIGKLIGAKGVAFYAIGLTLLGFIRSMLGVLYSPFSTRFNYFVGLKQKEEFQKFYLHVVKMTFPLVVFSLLIIAGMSKPLIISWVGTNYISSVDAAVWLVVCNILAFVSYPAGLMVVATERISQMYWISTLTVVLFWTGITLTFESWGIQSFAFFKFVSFLVSGIIYAVLSAKFIEMSLLKFIKKIALSYVPALLVLLVLLFNFNDIFIEGKSVCNLLINAGLSLFMMVVALVTAILFTKDLRLYVVRLYHLILN